MPSVKCSKGSHDDEVLRGGKRVRCRKCGDEFPCAHQCDHFDCKWVREDGEDVRVHAGSNLSKEIQS